MHRPESLRAPLAWFVLGLVLSACGGSANAMPEVPDDWDVHESPELGFTMAHPPDWDVATLPESGEVVYSGPSDAEIRVSAYRIEEGWSADRIFQGSEADVADRYGNPPVVVNELTVAEGARVLIFANQYTDDRGAFLFQRAAVIQDTDVWHVDWYSDVGDEGGDRQRFVEFVRSFVPAPDLRNTEGA
jgi:hypothetical protein